MVPQVIEAIYYAVEGGFNLPIVYNTSSYDSVRSIELLDGLVGKISRKKHHSIPLAEIFKVCHFEMFTKLRTLFNNMLFKMRCILLLKMIGGTSVNMNVDIR